MGCRGASWMETQSAVLMQGWKRPCLHRGFVEGRLPDFRLGGRHCRKWVTNTAKISTPRVERCCQPAANNTRGIALTNSSSSLQVSPADVLTSVPTSLSHSRVKNTTCHENSTPAARLCGYSEPHKLFLSHKLTFFFLLTQILQIKFP